MSRLIRPDDFFLFVEKARSIGLRSLLGKIVGTGRKRTEESWGHTSSARSNWWDLDEVTKRWNRLITGNANLAYQDYVGKKYLGGKRNLQAISVGCGTGQKEIQWAATKRFRTISGFDISGPRIAFAREQARKSTWNDSLRFSIGDVFHLDLPASSFDVAIFDNSLHHCSPLGPVLDRTAEWLKEDGILVVNEYVGPDRFQWTDEQVVITDTLLQLLPVHLRTRPDGTVKSRMLRPGTLAVRINDPSEAAESNSILSALESRFDVLELRPYGGTVLANLLKDIAHNFEDDGDDARAWLKILFDVEDRLMNEKRISSDYYFGVYRKRNTRKLARRK